MSLSAVKVDSPFHHCRLCTKAYSSEKSLNKHLRKKHAADREPRTQRSVRDVPDTMETASSQQADDSKLSGTFDSSYAENRFIKNDLLTLAVPLASRQSSGPQRRPPPVDDDLMIVCPECRGTIKSKKGVAKHYMCFHNVVYVAWKSGWFGRSVRLMDLTREMISEFHASGGTLEDKATLTRQAADSTVPIVSTSEQSKELPHEDETEELQGMVLDTVGEGEADDDSEASGGARSANELLRASPREEVRLFGTQPTTFRSKRSKLKTQLATTAPFFIGKEGKLEFNTNENPLDINCPFCITHKTTIKGLAKHCVNHHPKEYAAWKSGQFGSVQLRYVRPNSAVISQAIGEITKQPDDSTAHDSSPDTPEPPVGSKEGGDDGATNESGSATSPSTSRGNFSENTLVKHGGLGLFEDDKQATPCPFCGEHIFSKGMGKHCIYFHHDQYQEWKAGKFGSVPLRFVPSQVGCDTSELSERALKRREARKKNGISITLPLSDGGIGAGQQVSAAPLETLTAASVTVRVKPSPFRGEIYRCGECARVFDKSSSLSQHLRVHKYGPSMSKHGFQTQMPWTNDDAEGSCGEPLDDEENADRDLVFACHFCEAAFDSADELNRHFADSHPEGAPEGFWDTIMAVANQDDSETAVTTVRFICNVCPSRYRTKRGLGRHYQRHRVERFSSVLFDEDAESGVKTENAGARLEEREPGELSPSVREPSCPSPRPDRYFCSVCLSCFPSARSLAQHNRVHKFGSMASRISSTAGATNSAVSMNPQAAGSFDESASCIEDNESDGDDSHAASSGAAEGGLEISDTGGWAADPNADSVDTEEAAECPKCGKAFRNKSFLCGHLGRCFAKALAEGELEMRDLTTLAGIAKDDLEAAKQLEENKKVADSANDLTAENPTQPSLSYDCHQCGRMFSSQANLMKHNVVHTSSSVSCKTCLREFKMPCHLARHFCSGQLPQNQTVQLQQQARPQQPPPPSQQQQIQSQQKPQAQQKPPQPDDFESEGKHECEFCHRSFQYSGNLTVHKRFCLKHGVEPNDPGTEAEDGQLQIILLDCEDEVHECQLCNETFGDKASLDKHSVNCSLLLKPSRPVAVGQQLQPPQPQQHQQQQHPVQERERVLCPNCGKTYCRKDVLEAHMRTSCRGYPGAAAAAAAAAVPSASPMGPLIKRPRLDAAPSLVASEADRSTTFGCDLCPSQFSSSLGLVVHKSKCHPQFYGPSHRRAAASAAAATAAAAAEESVIECNACHNRFAKSVHFIKHRLVCPALVAQASSGAFKAAAAAMGEAAGSADQGPLLSLPNRCPRCPRAFLTDARLREHLSEAHPASNAAAAAATEGDSGLLLDGTDFADEAEGNGDNREDTSIGTEGDPMDSAGPGDEYSEADAYLCSECEKSFPSFDLLNRHLMDAHEIDAITPEAPTTKEESGNVDAAVLQPMQLTVVPTGARKRKSTPVAIC